ncbi:putative ribonuclease H-like domain-containing protein [Tanacetum coccineum]
MTCVTMPIEKPKFALGVKGATAASGSKLRRNTKKVRTLPAKSDKKKVEDHPRNNKSSVKRKNHVDSSISYKRTATGKLLANVDYQWKPTRRKFSLREQCPLTRFTKYKVVPVRQPETVSTSNIVIIERKLGKNKKYSHKPKSENTNMEVLHTLHMDLCGPMCVHSINGKKYILVIMDDYSRFTWVKFLRSKDETQEFVNKFLKQIQVEVVGTPCYIQNRSLIHIRYNKTPYELMHDKKPDLTFFCVFCALYYPTNNSKDLEILKPTADIRIFVRCAPNRKGYIIYNKRTHRIMEIIHIQFDELSKPMAPVHIYTGPEPIILTLGQICSRLVPNPVPAAPYVPPTNKDLEILFQPMFDEYFEPPNVERPIPPTPAAQVLVVSTGTPSSTTIDQDAPSTSHSPLSSVVQPPISHQCVAARPTIEDNSFAQADNDPFVNVFALEPIFDESSSGDTSLAESTQVTQPHNHLGKWSKDHPLDNVIGNPSCPVSTRK